MGLYISVKNLQSYDVINPLTLSIKFHNLGGDLLDLLLGDGRALLKPHQHILLKGENLLCPPPVWLKLQAPGKLPQNFFCPPLSGWLKMFLPSPFVGVNLHCPSPQTTPPSRHLQEKGCKTGLCGQAWSFPLFDPM